MSMSKEQWREVEGYEGLYEVSNYGRVRSLDRVVRGRWGNDCVKKGRVLTLSDDGQGYKIVSLSKRNKAKSFRVHRLVGAEFIPNLENKGDINHRDGNKANNYFENLEWATRKENINHAWSNGLNENIRKARIKYGKEAAKAMQKAHQKKVICIETGKTYFSMKDAAEFAKVHPSSISQVLRGISKTSGGFTWKFA